MNYEPCSLKAYKAEKPSTVWGKGKGELGKLQPDLENEELIAKVSLGRVGRKGWRWQGLGGGGGGGRGE